MGQNFTTLRSATSQAVTHIASVLMLVSCSTTPEIASESQSSSVERETLRATVFLPHPGRPGLRDSLPAHEPLVLVKKGWGYSMVRTVEGRVGEVPSEDIGPRTALLRSKPRVSGEWLPASTPRPVEEDGLGPKYPTEEPAGEAAEHNLDDVSGMHPVEPELPVWGSSADEM